MAVSLVYRWRRGFLTAVAGQRLVQAATRPVPSEIHDWEKLQELRTGRVTLWDHCFERIPSNVIPGAASAGPVLHRIGVEPDGVDKLETYDYPGVYAQRFDGVNRGGDDRAPHRHDGAAIYVAGKRGGTFIHGWPPCNLGICVVVVQQWEPMFQAIAAEAELSFSIEP
jgi:hypothetical protein